MWKHLALILFALTIFFTDDRNLYLPTCNVVVPMVIENDKNEKVQVLVFGAFQEDGSIKTVGRCPIDKIKGLLFGEKDEQVVYK